jgi:hypothetical protein
MEEYGDFEEFDDIDIQAVFADEKGKKILIPYGAKFCTHDMHVL